MLSGYNGNGTNTKNVFYSQTDFTESISKFDVNVIFLSCVENIA